MRSECFFVPDRTEVLALAEVEGGRMEKCAWEGGVGEREIGVVQLCSSPAAAASVMMG
jgi:hypothetical protein